MKFNWAAGIVTAIIGFIGFILFFVVTMTTDKAYSHDLVTEQYYQEELNYQQEIEAQKNAEVFKEEIKLQRVNNGLTIHFPKNIKREEGKVFLYRPSNKQLDFEMPISNSNTYLLVPEQRLLDGRWNIKILWKNNNKKYLIKKELVY